MPRRSGKVFSFCLEASNVNVSGTENGSVEYYARERHLISANATIA